MVAARSGLDYFDGVTGPRSIPLEEGPYPRPIAENLFRAINVGSNRSHATPMDRQGRWRSTGLVATADDLWWEGADKLAQIEMVVVKVALGEDAAPHYDLG